MIAHDGSIFLLMMEKDKLGFVTAILFSVPKEKEKALWCQIFSIKSTLSLLLETEACDGSMPRGGCAHLSLSQSFA